MINHQLFDKSLYPGSSTPKNPKVSVCLITYNHEDFIRTCLDSILSQITNFEFEIIIGEDGSTDKTAAIVKEYAEKYPTKIKAFIRYKNISAKLNYLHTFFSAKGEYIINIEGDDYFTDPEKLQIQADFLDKHQQFSACYHNAWMKFEDGSGIADYLINPENQKEITHTADFLVEKETWFMATASVMMRRKYVATLPNWFLKSKSGDIPLYAILTEYAPIAYINRVMSVYRRHLDGSSFTDNNQSIDFLKNRIFMYSKINEYTNKKYKHLIHSILGEYYLMMLKTNEIKNKWLFKCYYFLKAFYLLPKNSNQLLKDSFKESLMTNFIKKILKIYLIFR